ncbi:MAG: hypothetical protein IME96_13255 [Proteobacteria bacterium]|nr:hypothetical protein [Pseudomonadota bacterium]
MSYDADFSNKTTRQGSRMIIIKVKAYSGYKANERPLSFSMGEQEYAIEKIIDRWYGEDEDYFKVKAEDGCTYIIRYHRSEDWWDLVMMDGS